MAKVVAASHEVKHTSYSLSLTALTEKERVILYQLGNYHEQIAAFLKSDQGAVHDYDFANISKQEISAFLIQLYYAYREQLDEQYIGRQKYNDLNWGRTR